MSKEIENNHLITEELYKVLYLVKQLQNENLSFFTFRACIENYRKEIQKLKNPNLTKIRKEK